MLRVFFVLTAQLTLLSTANAMPHYRQDLVPVDMPFDVHPFGIDSNNVTSDLAVEGLPVYRVNINWDKSTDTLSFGSIQVEASGTPALVKRSRRMSELGSFHGIMYYSNDSKAYDAVGTGHLYRRLAGGLTFRFPAGLEPSKFVLIAEHPETGVMEKAIEKEFRALRLGSTPKYESAEVRVLKSVNHPDKITVTIYSEGYLKRKKNKFFEDAYKVVTKLDLSDSVPAERMEYIGVFHPSKTRIGKVSHRRAGDPRKEKNSFLGMNHPYWEPFGRWYHVIYPTNEVKLRDGLGQAPYDYPIVLVDSDRYWGVGNYNQLTAIPADSPSFTYLLYHEFGHFMGLNEEYQGGGRTELEFAPKMEEPWSQNITFLRDPTELKWGDFVDDTTTVPTPRQDWSEGHYGAYPGGYADSHVHEGRSHIPGYACVMGTFQPQFCEICHSAMAEKYDFDSK